jgi:colanic acid/amylovoran biosynthesis glycosyltransferase
VAEEIQAIRSRGINARIVSLLEPGPGPAQPLSERLLPYTWYAPGLRAPGLWRAQLHFLLKSPRLYLDLLTTLLRQPYPTQPMTRFLKRLVIFLKAVSVAHYLECRDSQLLHAHFAWLSGAAAWISARLLGLPFTVTVHAFDIYSQSNDLLCLVSEQASQVVAISEYNRVQVAALRTRPADTISVIHCGVNLEKIDGQTQRQVERPAGGPLRILSVGGLQAKKGHKYLIAACHLLKERGLDFNCTIIGGGPGEPGLRRQIQAYGLQDRVELLGARSHPEIIAAYRQHDLFVLASVVAPGGDRDGIPVVLMEAGSLGLPLISTWVSGIPELVRHNQTGWLVPPGDTAALADAVAALGADPVMRARLGQHARSLVEAQFSIESNAGRLAALFQNTCQQWNHSLDLALSQSQAENGSSLGD